MRGRWSVSRWCCRQSFIPIAFFGGTAGAIYRRFSITIVSAMVLSVLVADPHPAL
ncbi:efflux RND transporter permease subunit [Enterobacter chuandaensis]|uniref:efflux RND transporter permease subunit n=1 Tax=Enterobacter chuandaensis TaxID=2497875 RepID=UPI0034D9750F